jgi:DmsE family decaheme c-type cytochrome
MRRLLAAVAVVGACAFCHPGMAQSDVVKASEMVKKGYTDERAQTCLSCHNDESMLLIFRTAHGQDADPEAPMAHLQCEACHGPGAEHADRRQLVGEHPRVVDFGRDSETPIEEQNAACLNCHTRHMGLEWQGSPHERNLVTCADCHDVHATVDPVSLLTEQANVCYECHSRQRSDAFKPYAHPVRFGVMTCTSCHDPHHSVADNLLTRNTTNELCFDCHTELRGPYLFEHEPVTEDCTLCHYAHGSINPALLNKRPPLLCQSCHSQAGHPSIPYTPGGLPGGSPSAFLLNGSCLNCHSQVHGSNHPSGANLMR